MQLSHGTLLGGRVPYAQPRSGYRTGIEPVLLAAAVPARPGDRVMEAGTGAGAGLLCLLARVPTAAGVGIELDAAMAAVARLNAAASAAAMVVHVADVADAGGHGPVDHAFANPPWHDPAGTRPPDPARARAKHRAGAGLRPWIEGLSQALTPRGTLTLILPPQLVPDALDLMRRAGLAHSVQVPLWPKAGRTPKLILLQGSRSGPAQMIHNGLILHETDGSYTAAANAVLRGGEALRLSELRVTEMP